MVMGMVMVTTTVRVTVAVAMSMDTIIDAIKIAKPIRKMK